MAANEVNDDGRAALAGVLGQIPESLRDELVQALNEIVRNFRERRWEPSELNGGKLCEVVYTILRGYIDGTYPARASKPSNIVDACRGLESARANLPRSVRIQVPRVLMALYETRNNRGVGHVGGDVDPNHMDAVAVLSMSRWVVAELIRIFHNVTTDVAAAIVEALSERELPIIWEVGGRKRVLDTGLTTKERMLVVLYQERGPVTEDALADWIEHPQPAVLRRDIIRPAHTAKLIDYDEKSRVLHLSPLGAAFVETKISLQLGSGRSLPTSKRAGKSKRKSPARAAGERLRVRRRQAPGLD